MRALRIALLVVLAGCCPPEPGPKSPASPPVAAPADPPSGTPAAPDPVAPPIAPPAPLAADTPSATVAGHAFVAPAGWTVTVRGAATIVAAPEGDSWIALVDVTAKDADAAVAAAWAAYKPGATWPLVATTAAPDQDGWQDRKRYAYRTSPNEQRGVFAVAQRAGDQWSVIVYDMANATRDKRSGQVAVIFGRYFPKGYERETFAGKPAHPLDAPRVKELTAFVERAQQALGVPGVSIGLIQGGKTVFTGGFGVRELGKPAKPDGDTLYLIASNTKPMTTLLLGKLVDEGALTWDTPVTQVMPSFKLGDADTTSKVLVRHLVCACTGLPRQDFQWLLEFKTSTAASALASLGGMQPTSKFGELFQYSNLLAAAAGYVGAYALAPKRELGAAYDEAMQSRVFGPLGMTSTTFDFKRALRGNHAKPHSLDLDGKVAAAAMPVNYSIVPVRPAGGAWSSVKDVLKYVQMELSRGLLPNGKRYVSEAVLAERQVPQVAVGKDRAYAMGLQVDTTYGTPVVSHGGSLIGFKSDMLWLPEHGVGAVVLTNGDAGSAIARGFTRKLLEVLFDGKPEADAAIEATAKATQIQLAAERKLLAVPPDPAAAGALAARYASPELGELRVRKAGDAVIFDFGEVESPVATKAHPDGTVSFVTTTPGFSGLELVVGGAGAGAGAGGKRTLVFREAQREYVFTEQ